MNERRDNTHMETDRISEIDRQRLVMSGRREKQIYDDVPLSHFHNERREREHIMRRNRRYVLHCNESCSLMNALRQGNRNQETRWGLLVGRLILSICLFRRSRFFMFLYVCLPIGRS